MRAVRNGETGLIAGNQSANKNQESGGAGSEEGET
jgi:hypothetical protein